MDGLQMPPHPPRGEPGTHAAMHQDRDSTLVAVAHHPENTHVVLESHSRELPSA